MVRALQWAAGRSGARKSSHLALGQQGETEAYFYLKRQGYRFVATNFRVPHNRGEIDLIGWDGDVLCFVEVKTRTDDSFAPPSAAVTQSKQHHILSVAKRYLRRLPSRPPCRFDILSIVPSDAAGEFQFTLRKGAFTWDRGRQYRPRYGDRAHRRFWRRARY